MFGIFVGFEKLCYKAILAGEGFFFFFQNNTDFLLVSTVFKTI